MRTSDKPWHRKSRGAWYVTLNGKQIRLAADRAEAKRKWLKLMNEGGSPADTSFQRCVDHYLPTLAEKTRRTREQTLNAFMRHAGKIRVSKLTEKHVRSFLKSEWSASTKRSHIKTILACLNRAVKDGLVDSNPLKDVEKPSWERREQILSSEELRMLFEASLRASRSVRF